jgi:hypothetical protein
MQIKPRRFVVMENYLLYIHRDSAGVQDHLKGEVWKGEGDGYHLSIFVDD